MAGYAIAETSLVLVRETELSEGVIGTLATAIATSTPELVTTLAGVRRGALTLAFGGIVGGNTFDVLFTEFADIAYRDGSIYHAMGAEQVFVALLTIMMTAVLLLGLIRRERQGVGNIGFESLSLLLLYTGGMALLLAGGLQQ